MIYASQIGVRTGIAIFTSCFSLILGGSPLGRKNHMLSPCKTMLDQCSMTYDFSIIFPIDLVFFLVVLINLVSPSPVVLINLVSPSLQTKVMCDGAVGWFNRNPFSGLQNRWSADRLALSVYLSISFSLSFSLSLFIFLSLYLSLSLPLAFPP